MNTEYIDVNQGDTYIDKFGVEYSSDKKRLIKGCNIEHYIVMEGTEIICDYAFKSLNIKNIVLPDSLKAIGACAFANNESLETIEISVIAPCVIPFHLLTKALRFCFRRCNSCMGSWELFLTNRIRTA